MRSRRTLPILTLCIGAVVCAQSAAAFDFSPYLRSTQPRSDVGLDVAADALNLRGGITTRRVGTTTKVMPQFVSSLAVATNMKLESKATFADWNTDSRASNDVETKLTASSVFPMIAEVEGLLRHTNNGESRRKVRLKLRETRVPSLPSLPLVFRANASVETVDSAGAGEQRLTGIEAALVQLPSTAHAVNRIRFKYTSRSGPVVDARESTTFSRTWVQNKLLHLGLEYELTREASVLASAVRFSWRGSF